jgi:hypothetical protein
VGEDYEALAVVAGTVTVWSLLAELPRLNIAGHFLCWCKESNQRKHLFNLSIARLHPIPPTAISHPLPYLVCPTKTSRDQHEGWRLREHEQRYMSFLSGLTALGFVQSKVSSLFMPVTRRRGSRVIARRKRAVRGEHQGRALRGQCPLGERKSFFGDFLPISKKSPASRRIAEALVFQLKNIKSKDPRFPLPRE